MFGGSRKPQGVVNERVRVQRDIVFSCRRQFSSLQQKPAVRIVSRKQRVQFDERTAFPLPAAEAAFGRRAPADAHRIAVTVG